MELINTPEGMGKPRDRAISASTLCPRAPIRTHNLASFNAPPMTVATIFDGMANLFRSTLRRANKSRY